MEKPPGSFGGASDAKPETAPKEMPKFGSTATFGSAPLAFGGSSFGKPAGSGFFNIAPSFAEPAAPAPKAPTSLDFFSSTTTSITFNMPKFQWGQGPAASQTTAATTNSLFGVNPEKPSTAPEKKEEEEDGEGDEGADAEQPHSPPQVYTTTPITRPTEPIMTGEENEVHVHQVNKAKLYRLDKDEVRTFWKEKGVGQVRINRSRESPHESRILMRMDGAFKLMLNSKIFPTMPARLVGENSVALSALSDEGGSNKVELCNFLIKVQGRVEAELLLGAIEVQKQKAAEAPEDEAREKGASKRGADDGSAKKEEHGKPKSPAKSPGKVQEAAKKARRRSEEAKGTEKEKEPRGGDDKREGDDAEAGRAAKEGDSE